MDEFNIEKPKPIRPFVATKVTNKEPSLHGDAFIVWSDLEASHIQNVPGILSATNFSSNEGSLLININPRFDSIDVIEYLKELAEAMS